MKDTGEIFRHFIHSNLWKGGLNGFGIGLSPPPFRPPSILLPVVVS